MRHARVASRLVEFGVGFGTCSGLGACFGSGTCAGSGTCTCFGSGTCFGLGTARLFHPAPVPAQTLIPAPIQALARVQAPNPDPNSLRVTSSNAHATRRCNLQSRLTRVLCGVCLPGGSSFLPTPINSVELRLGVVMKLDPWGACTLRKAPPFSNTLSKSQCSLGH